MHQPVISFIRTISASHGFIANGHVGINFLNRIHEYTNRIAILYQPYLHWNEAILLYRRHQKYIDTDRGIAPYCDSSSRTAEERGIPGD
jgi:hypothetical protein